MQVATSQTIKEMGISSGERSRKATPKLAPSPLAGRTITGSVMQECSVMTHCPFFPGKCLCAPDQDTMHFQEMEKQQKRVLRTMTKSTKNQVSALHACPPTALLLFRRYLPHPTAPSPPSPLVCVLLPVNRTCKRLECVAAYVCVHRLMIAFYYL